MATNIQAAELSAENVKDNIKRHISMLRKANGLSMHDVAKALNMNENTYRIWEDAKRSCPRPSEIVKVAKLYNVSVDFLMSDYDKPDDKKNVASPDTYNDTEQNEYLSSLDKYEKLFILSIRQLTPEQKEDVAKYIHKVLFGKE